MTTGMDLELGAMNVDAWYAAKLDNWPVNYGTAVSHEMARMIVHDGLGFAGPTDATTGFKLRAQAGENGIYTFDRGDKFDLDRVRAIQERTAAIETAGE